LVFSYIWVSGGGAAMVLGADEAASPPGDVPLSKSHYIQYLM
jgi:hypothetical protein